MNFTPDFIDNRDGNTLAEALARVLGGSIPGGLAEATVRPAELAIAAAFFSPKGLADLAPHIDGLQRARLMFGVEAPRDFEMRRPNLGESLDHFEARLMREGLKDAEAAARAARDRFPFTREGVAALHRLIQRLRGQNVEVRRYERAFMHAKAYIFVPPADAIDGKGGVIVGSSNLTGGGLSRNLELNLGRYDDPVVTRARAWFDALWEEADPVNLARLYEDIFAPYTPWEIFLRILFQLYGGEVAELEKEDKGLPLTSFQTHGVARALRLLKTCGGALVADEVGLGKTFIAGEIIRLYHSRRQRGLLVCPAQLRDTTWKKFIARWQFDLAIESVSYEELANDIKLRDAQRPHATKEHLQRPLDEYQLIVIDEAHNYRNPDTPTRAAVLRRLLFGRPRDVLLLTATPVNNSLWDLFHMIRFFARQDAFLADRGVLSVYDRFHQATREDPSNLSPDLLYPIIDATCVKRTRQFVKKHYSGDTIKGPDGRDHPIVFPQPRAMTVRYALDDPLPELFDVIEDALDPDGGPHALTFSRYTVDGFRHGQHDADTDAKAASTIGLIRSGLLKRFESSAFAFVSTLNRLIHGHKVFLEALGKGHVVTTRFLQEIAAQDETMLDELLKASVDTFPARDFDSKSLRKAVESDLAKLSGLQAKAAKIAPHRDPKLNVLVIELEKIAAQAKEEATDAIDEAQRRKVLLFSFFADTVNYVRNFLRQEVERNPTLAAYRKRVIAVTGDDDLEEIKRQEAIYGFAPISTEAPLGRDADLYDILITTDVLAKGKDLGVLFCAAVGDRTYLRFMPVDDAWRPRGTEDAIISELGSCLRIVECEPHTPRIVPKELEEDRIFDLWEAAQSHVWRSWMIETDPANLQPKLRPLNRKAAEFIRANPRPEIDSTRITLALDVLESPWPLREEMMLREWFKDETRAGTAKSAYLIEKILETGLEPFREPPTLAPIRVDEIELVCWMAISPEKLEEPDKTA